MLYINLPDNEQKRLIFYLAMEEFVAKHIGSLIDNVEGDSLKEAFFIWQVPPTVIFGRNQVMEAEVNLPYCREKGIRLFRRKSGGGCVYADLGNIMVSYISNSTDVALTFDKYLQSLALALRKLGLNSDRSGRNDVMVNDKKVSGNAFFLKPKASVVHGTLLYNSDFEELTKAITPSDAKIKSKGVSSVRQHVTNVREELERAGNDIGRQMLDIEKFKDYLRYEFCGIKNPDGSYSGLNSITLTEEQIAEVLEIEATYLEPEFFAGRNHSYSATHTGKIEGVGEITVELELDGDVIVQTHLKGDFFPLKDGLDDFLTSKLNGVRYNKESIAQALENQGLESYILNLGTKSFITKIFN